MIENNLSQIHVPSHNRMWSHAKKNITLDIIQIQN